MLKRGMLGVLAAALALSGCSGSDTGAKPGAKDTVTATVTVTASPSSVITESPEPSSTDSADASAPNVGESALTVGDTREGSALRTTLKTVRYPYPPAEYRQAESGNVFLGLELEQCVKADAEVDPDQPFYSTYNSEWSAVTPDGFEFGGDGSSWDDWPSPKFHESVTMSPGRCVKGWIAVQVPKGTKIASLIWRPDGVETAEWLPVS
jgi:hypothetical protein